MKKLLLSLLFICCSIFAFSDDYSIDSFWLNLMNKTENEIYQQFGFPNSIDIENDSNISLSNLEKVKYPNLEFKYDNLTLKFYNPNLFFDFDEDNYYDNYDDKHFRVCGILIYNDYKKLPSNLQKDASFIDIVSKFGEPTSLTTYTFANKKMTRLIYEKQINDKTFYKIKSVEKTECIEKIRVLLVENKLNSIEIERNYTLVMPSGK